MAQQQDPPLPWTSDSLQTWAQAVFPSDFEALPDHSTLTFKDLEDNATHLSTDSAKLIKWPPDLIRKLLLIGTCGSMNDVEEKIPVLAYIHGEKHNQVGYIGRTREGDSVNGSEYVKMNVNRRLMNVAMDQPFYNFVENHSYFTAVDHGKMRALVCYYFVARGLVDEIGYYPSFLKEFKMACALVAEGEPESTVGSDSDEATTSSELTDWHTSEYMPLQRHSNRKRKAEAEVGDDNFSSKRQKHEDAFYHYHEQIEVTYTKIKNENIDKNVEIANLKHRITMLESKYSIKKTACAELEHQLVVAKEEVDKEKQNVEEANKKAEEANSKAEEANIKAKEANRKAEEAGKKAVEARSAHIITKDRGHIEGEHVEALQQPISPAEKESEEQNRIVDEANKQAERAKSTEEASKKPEEAKNEAIEAQSTRDTAKAREEVETLRKQLYLANAETETQKRKAEEANKNAEGAKFAEFEQWKRAEAALRKVAELERAKGLVVKAQLED